MLAAAGAFLGAGATHNSQIEPEARVCFFHFALGASTGRERVIGGGGAVEPAALFIPARRVALFLLVDVGQFGVQLKKNANTQLRK